MHILFILDYFTPHRGGSETVFENITNRLIKKGYKVSVLTSHFDKKLKKIEKFQKSSNGKTENLTIYRIGKNRINFMFLSLFLGTNILRKNKDIKIIHTSTYGGAIPASILGILFHKKVVITIHEIFGKLRNFYKGKFFGFLYRLFENSIFLFPYDIYHCVSTYTLNSIRISYNIPDSKLKMIHNGVDTDFWNPEKTNKEEITKLKKKYGLDNKITLLYYGHAGKSKGIDYLVQSIPDILKIDPNIKIIFNIINSKRKELLMQKILKYKNNNTEKILLFDGFNMKELRDLIECSDIVIAPSISEGFGSVHTESVSMGKILLTTNISSIPEVVRGKVKFINPRSSQEITNGVKEILEGKIENINKKNFSRDETTAKIETLYQNLSNHI